MFKPFLGLSSLAGAEGLEPSARGFGANVESKKAHIYADFKPFLYLQNIIDAILMLLVIL